MGLLHAQQFESTTSGGISITDEGITPARILGTIPDGTPPPPAPSKPVYQVAERDVLKVKHHEQCGRTVTIREIKPVALPPLPEPMARGELELTAEFRERVAEFRAKHPRSNLLFLGATVFLTKDSPPRTLVRYWPGGKGGGIMFWSSADFSLIAGGINAFQDTKGNHHHLMMSWSRHNVEQWSEFHARKGRLYQLPDLPVFSEGKATYRIVGEQPDAEALVSIDALHELYNRELEQLKTAYAGRERARLERDAHLRANPPQPKDITLNYWRIEKPAASPKGESK